MRYIRWGDKCPFCGNTSRKRLHKKGFYPIVKRYACKWCSLAYSSVLRWFTVGVR
ncbi:MAG: hypothetical protein KAU06_03190 [Candidatus Marinimicrobia bacterium]|nr:hypothetical protein [Candidatus Neomarinimicrobiota bacterium]